MRLQQSISRFQSSFHRPRQAVYLNILFLQVPFHVCFHLHLDSSTLLV
jgi:hypothetical protein